MKVIVINGLPRTGKDTFVSYCLEELGDYGHAFSTVDFVKEIAKTCGWNGQKTAKDRKFLSDLKDLLNEWNDVPYQKIRSEIAKIYLIAEQYGLDHDKFVIFIHCREPEEIQRFVDEYKAITVLMRRTEVEGNPQSNHSDSGVFNYNYDIIIWNDENLEFLKETANFFLENLEKF